MSRASFALKTKGLGVERGECGSVCLGGVGVPYGLGVANKGVKGLRQVFLAVYWFACCFCF